MADLKSSIPLTSVQLLIVVGVIVGAVIFFALVFSGNLDLRSLGLPIGLPGQSATTTTQIPTTTAPGQDGGAPGEATTTLPAYTTSTTVPETTTTTDVPAGGGGPPPDDGGDPVPTTTISTTTTTMYFPWCYEGEVCCCDVYCGNVMDNITQCNCVLMDDCGGGIPYWCPGFCYTLVSG